MTAHAVGHDDQRAQIIAVVGFAELIDHVSIFLIVAGTINLIACNVEFDFHRSEFCFMFANRALRTIAV